ncbi:protein of unknown function [Acidithiobacillus ferrivorans]|jgi:hypothetical protein|nr:protein of unknown function [Acidithiobacillus ferrivorans]
MRIEATGVVFNGEEDFSQHLFNKAGIGETRKWRKATTAENAIAQRGDSGIGRHGRILDEGQAHRCTPAISIPYSPVLPVR